MSGEVCRYDRHGRAEYRKPPQSEATKRAIDVLQAAIDRSAAQDRAAQKARQDSGQMTPQERMLSAIFGEIK